MGDWNMEFARLCDYVEAVVDKQTKHSWFFINYLKEDLQLGTGEGLTVMADMQKMKYYQMLKLECVLDTSDPIGIKTGRKRIEENNFGNVLRHKYIITMLEEIRRKIMTRTVDMIKFANTWISDIAYMARLILEENKDRSRACKVLWNANVGFDIEEGEYRHTLKLD
ncbi:hypothetical protein HAX54_036875 [Datura stramonium]|uniref:Uncharacterized protein n=1 Tax=Datura stramonium TaxID=4076 RepID=A0ABS8VHI1_DATST|nr:hypothetical protein [Datura stramonium]